MTSVSNFAPTFVKDKKWFEENIKDKAGFKDCSHHVDTKKTKKALGLKAKDKKKIKVFIHTDENEHFDERANPQIVYKYDVCCFWSHPLGKDGEWGFSAKCPQGTAYVIY